MRKKTTDQQQTLPEPMTPAEPAVESAGLEPAGRGVLEL